MSFLKKLLAPKAGGSFLGNLVRGVANKASGGILGNGAMLNASLAKQAAKAAQAAPAPPAPPARIGDTAEFEAQTKAFQNIAMDVAKTVAGAAANTPQGRAIGFQAIKGAMGKWFPLLYIIPLGLVAGAVYYFTRKKSSSNRRRY